MEMLEIFKYVVVGTFAWIPHSIVVIVVAAVDVVVGVVVDGKLPLFHKWIGFCEEFMLKGQTIIW